jgi:hypothetical protein
VQRPNPWPSGGPLYLSPPGKKATASEVPPVRKYMRLGYIAQIATPPQGTALEPDVLVGRDTGLFGKGYPGDDKWFAWLTQAIDRHGAQHCVWATAPDVPFDSAGTLARSLPWLGKVRSLGVPAAFCAQNGSHKPGMIPWDDIDVLFLAGGPRCAPCGYDGPGAKATPKSLPRCPYCGKRAREWKESPIAADLAAEALARGLKVHMGRVNSERRMRIATAYGCSTIDGTFVIKGPDKNIERMRKWYTNLPKRQAPHVELPLFEIQGVAA